MVDLLKNKYLHNVALLSIPIILFSLSQETISTNKSLCLFSNIFEVQCYGCGTYRAIMSFLNVEIILKSTNSLSSSNKIVSFKASLSENFTLDSFVVTLSNSSNYL